ncbi:HAAS signaling domain-containing protein [Gorillibacterium sp. sgz5001074]|uniref:HAAS signaling domain-containing protein n=1 Tax=Gorillibacterium sp. sgz5001074 TaxID=3446695 RepID=UPI003F67B82C
MSKAAFFLQLQDRLRGLPYEEQQNIIRVYEDLFRQAELSGKSEREIIESLGYVPVPMPPQASEPSRIGADLGLTARNGVRSVASTVALLFFNLIVVLAPFLTVAALLFTFSVLSFLFTFSSIWILFGTGVPTSLTLLLTEVFTALLLTGAGVLMGIGLWKINRGFLKLTQRYIRLNLKLIKGE